jgi:hypothetical protein
MEAFQAAEGILHQYEIIPEIPAMVIIFSRCKGKFSFENSFGGAGYQVSS